jgi:hypothetical protein
MRSEQGYVVAAFLRLIIIASATAMFVWRRFAADEG